MADSFRIAARSAVARPPHTKAMTAIMVIQVAVVTGRLRSVWAVGVQAALRTRGLGRENRVGGDWPGVRDPLSASAAVAALRC